MCKYQISNPIDLLAKGQRAKKEAKVKKEKNDSNNSFYSEKNAKHSFHISTLLCIFQRLPKGINASILFLMVHIAYHQKYVECQRLWRITMIY